MANDWSKATVLIYPDPRLRQKCRPVERFDDDLAALARRMLELMRQHRGVGLAAAQVGVPLRLFVMNTSDDPAADRIYVNPVLSELEGGKENEEGCLSLPEVHVIVRRAAQCRLSAQNLDGSPVTAEARDLACRVWQHEVDHLNGVLIIDRMGPSDKIATRKRLREMTDKFVADEARRRS